MDCLEFGVVVERGALVEKVVATVVKLSVGMLSCMLEPDALVVVVVVVVIVV
jgi:hypothetical protein